MVFWSAISIVKQHYKAFLILNLIFYGLFVISFCLTLVIPELQGYVKPSIDQAYIKEGVLKTVADAYGGKNLVLAVTLTFVVNLSVAIGLTTLPSLIIPFVGILAIFHRAILWGVMFAPVGPYPETLIPHSMTLVIEGQAYILAAFAAYVHGRSFFWSDRYAVLSVGGYKEGLVSSLHVYSLVVLTLLIAAVYEGIEVIYFIPFFLNS